MKFLSFCDPLGIRIFFFISLIINLFKETFERKTIRFDSLAQQVEHNTFNVGVLGSSPKRITEREELH